VRLITLLAGLTILLTGTTLVAQISGDVLGVHNLGPGGGAHIQGVRPDACSYCHAPHSGLNRGLWNQKLTTSTYTTYTSDTEANSGKQPTLGYSSNQCLSCHDGTVGLIGQTVAYGKITMSGSMNAVNVLGTNMQRSHPFSMKTPLNDSVDLFASIALSKKTGDTTGAVKLINGNVECVSCHNPHVQAKDTVSQNFLVKVSSGGELCLACHDPTRTKAGFVNQLADWSGSQHAQSSAAITPSAMLGSYSTVAANACISCHAPHNAALGISRLLRGQNEQDCISCHNGANLTPVVPYTNVFAEYASPKVGHPFPAGSNTHDATEKVLLNNNRHATCVDCHNAHGSEQVGIFPTAPLIRISQKNIAGVSASDGTSLLTPAINQYENCLRCHGTSTAKATLPIYGYFPLRAVSAPDPLDVRPEFATSAPSSHPVMHGRTSSLTQYSLLPNMLNLDGSTQGRAMGTQILCTDCHNSDDNREFGGTGANGPHGSKWSHILERRYEFNTATTAGGVVGNLFTGPDLTVTGPYALCGKCHDLPNQIMQNTSFSKHSLHIGTYGFSCSVCHTAHGMGAQGGNIDGQRMVNFDMHIVAQNGSNSVSYTHSGTQNTCVLTCHQYDHNQDGTVTHSLVRKSIGIKK